MKIYIIYLVDYCQVIAGRGVMKRGSTIVPEMDTNYRHRNGGGMAIGSMCLPREKQIMMDGSMLSISQRKFVQPQNSTLFISIIEY